MFKTFMIGALTFLFLLSGAGANAEAATKKSKKKKATTGQVVTGKKRKSKKYAKNSKSRRRGGSSVDLRALTTESPYTDNPENGVNSIETKPGLQ